MINGKRVSREFREKQREVELVMISPNSVNPFQKYNDIEASHRQPSSEGIVRLRQTSSLAKLELLDLCLCLQPFGQMNSYEPPSAAMDAPAAASIALVIEGQ